MHLFSLVVLASVALVSAAPQDSSPTTSESAPTPSCISFDYLATISNVVQKNMTGPAPPTYSGTYASLPNLSVSGSYKISASLCAPTVRVAHRSRTLQLLVHGFSYTRTYWSGLEFPPNSFNGSTYSWIDYAASQGYWTLAIDRLCNGDSSHPDPADVCQLQAEAATIHSMVQAAKAGTLYPQSNKAFDKIIFVGHSAGSLLGNLYANKYTSDLAALVLTGYSSSLLNAVPATTAAGSFGPASGALSRFSSLPAPYLVYLSKDIFRGEFFYGGFDEWVVNMNFQGRGTGTYGELLSLALGLVPAPNVKIPVYVIDGQEDQVFCSVAPIDLVYGGRGRCGSGPDNVVARTKVLFPNASNFGSGLVPNAGHCFNLHFSARLGFKMTHDYLASQGF